MSKGPLKWTATDDGLIFAFQLDGENVSLSRWPLVVDRLSSSAAASVAVLMLLIENEKAGILGDNTVLVESSRLAELKPQQILDMGLPEPAPFTLQIVNKGLLTDPDFQFDYYYVTHKGRPVQGVTRRGVILHTGSRAYSLLDPLYSIVERLDRFNGNTGNTTEDAFRTWGEVTKDRTDQVRVDPYLDDMRVASIDAFTIEFGPGERGGTDLRPVPLFRPSKSEAGAEDDESIDGLVRSPQRVLPPVVEERFQAQFASRDSVKERYALDGWYVFLSQDVKCALRAVHSAQRSDEETRRQFLRNPHAAIRATMPDYYEDDQIESVFLEPEGYGARVREIGTWQPKMLPVIKRAKDPWLPPEQLGLMIDGRYMMIDPLRVRQVRDEVSGALKDGVPSIEYDGQQLPASEETLSVLDSIIDALPDSTGQEKETHQEGEEATARSEDQVLLLGDKDNLEQEGYRPDLCPRDDCARDLPSVLKSQLKPHQESGLTWLQSHWMGGSKGALLADDMGLGKTLLCLAFLAWLKEQTRSLTGPFLIVTPTALTENWADEHNKHLREEGLGTICKARGSELRALRQDRYHDWAVSELKLGGPTLDDGQLRSHDVVITTYETLRNNSHSFGRVPWSVAVLDEAQKIKNPSSLLSEQCKAVISKAEFVVALTGTPVENRLADLWSILDACQPGSLGTLKEFSSKYEGEMEESRGLLRDLHGKICEPDEPGSDVGDLPRVILRRLKSDHLEGLPAKRVNLIRQTMPRIQADAYSQAVRNAQLTAEEKGAMLKALHSIRSISLHPIRYSAAGPSKGGDDEFIAASARLSATIEILDGIHDAEERALIFLESQDLQPILQSILQRRYSLPEPPLIINGAVSGPARQKRVRRFQDSRGFGVMILSPRAAGVGLTLTSANHVIHLSRWWNPAVEDQCTDRVYRIGQDKEVRVYLPIAVHPEYGEASFDIKLHQLLETKRQLNQMILAPTIASSADVAQLYADTVCDLSPAKSDATHGLNHVLGLGQPQFHLWLGELLRYRGYAVRDASSESNQNHIYFATLSHGDASHALLVASHAILEGDKCDEAPVEELVRLVRDYESGERELIALVISSSRSFNRKGQKLAKKHNIRLLEGNAIGDLADTSKPLPWML